MSSPEVQAPPYLVTLMGFTGFEQQALESYLTLARSREPAYALSDGLEDSRFVIANGDRSGVIDLLRAAQRLGDTLLVGSQSHLGAAACLERPIDPMNLFHALDEAVQRRSLVATAARAAGARGVSMAEWSQPWKVEEPRIAFFAPTAVPGQGPLRFPEGSLEALARSEGFDPVPFERMSLDLSAKTSGDGEAPRAAPGLDDRAAARPLRSPRSGRREVPALRRGGGLPMELPPGFMQPRSDASPASKSRSDDETRSDDLSRALHSRSGEPLGEPLGDALGVPFSAPINEAFGDPFDEPFSAPPGDRRGEPLDASSAGSAAPFAINLEPSLAAASPRLAPEALALRLVEGPHRPIPMAESLNALVVDAADTQALVALFESQNVKTTCVTKPHHAFALIDSFAFDFVAVDVDLGAASNLDGLQVSQAIRRQSRPPGDFCPPVMLMSTHPQPIEQARALLAGAHVYLRKPLQPSALASALVHVGLRPDSQADASPSPQAPAIAPRADAAVAAAAAASASAGLIVTSAVAAVAPTGPHGEATRPLPRLDDAAEYKSIGETVHYEPLHMEPADDEASGLVIDETMFGDATLGAPPLGAPPAGPATVAKTSVEIPLPTLDAAPETMIASNDPWPLSEPPSDPPRRSDITDTEPPDPA